jgi:hypothetical protein
MFAIVSPALLGLLTVPLNMPEGGSTWMYLIAASVACGAALVFKRRSSATRRA